MTDVTRSYLLMNIVEDNDKESLKLLTESYLEKIASWIEPFRGPCTGGQSGYDSIYRTAGMA